MKQGLLAPFCFVAAACVLVVMAASPATAQDDPIYGPTTTTTTTPSGATPTCTLTIEVGAPGATGVAHVQNVPFGATVRILIGGVEVGRGTAPLQGQAAATPVRFGGQVLAAQAGTTSLDISFTVPEVGAGTQQVTAVGADFAITCAPDGFDVLGSDGGTDGTDGDIGGGGGSLPRTGIYALLLLAVAVALLLLGRAFIEAARRRRRAAAREARAQARHLAARTDRVESAAK